MTTLQQAQLSLTNRAMPVCKVVEVSQLINPLVNRLYYLLMISNTAVWLLPMLKVWTDSRMLQLAEM